MVDLIDIPKPVITVIYNQKDITRNISQYLIDFVYTDHLNGESDELSITVQNSDGRWTSDWYPGKGDTLTAKLAFKGVELSCGTFEIDEVEASKSNGTVTISALATGLSSPLRTKQTKAFEETTLGGIAAEFARKHNLALAGQIRDIPIDRATQYHETDLHFLKRLGKEYGYLFSVKKGHLLFSELATLRTLAASFTVTPDMLSDDSIKDKIKGVYQKVEQTRHNPVKRKLTHYSNDSDLSDSPHSTSSDTLRHHKRAHTRGAAQVQSQAALDHANIEKTTGSISFTVGDARVRSGVALGLAGFGVFSGTYQIDTASHAVNRSGGYVVSAEIKRTDKLPVLSKSQKSMPLQSKPAVAKADHVKVLKGRTTE